jgi:formylglycine-generating enzyme required for sulfatase activity
MSASSVSFRSEHDTDYAVDFRGSFAKISKQNRRPQYRRSSAAPGSVNGIHRRRNSRWTWGHGRGASARNLTAFAGCALAAVAALWASAASAVTISFGTSAPAYNLNEVGNPGNAANSSAPVSVQSLGGGSVPYAFMMGVTEVTNAQYAYFLNSVAKTDTWSLWNSGMNTTIARSGAPGSRTYTAAPSTANRPVTFVSIYDALRFANWVQNGLPTTGVQDASTTENGTYVMTGTTGQPIRQAGTQFWIPSTNEWYKAAFYNPTVGGTGGYMTYATNSNTLTMVPPPGGATSANMNNAVGSLTDVGSYTSADSYYGMYDMAGNASERTDSINNPTSYLMGASQFTSNFNVAASNNSLVVSAASNADESPRLGFRLAAAVPEPSTFVLAGMGTLTALIGWGRKRMKGLRRQA